MTFVVGPMCELNRISGEPPSHRECAEFSAACFWCGEQFPKQRHELRCRLDERRDGRRPVTVEFDAGFLRSVAIF